MIVVATWPLLLPAQAWPAAGAPRRGVDDDAVAVAAGGAALFRHHDHRGERHTDRGLVEIACDFARAAAPGLGGSLPGGRREVCGAVALPRGPGRSPLGAHRALCPAALLWFVAHVGSIGLLLVTFLLTVIIAAILYANGEAQPAAQTVSPGASRGRKVPTRYISLARRFAASRWGSSSPPFCSPWRLALGWCWSACRSQRF